MSKRPEKSIEEVYRGRNLLAISHAAVMAGTEYPAGWHHPDDDWPVVWFEIPTETGTRQVGHHVPEFNVPLLERSRLPEAEPPGGYDGHTRRDRLNRLTSHAIHAPTDE